MTERAMYLSHAGTLFYVPRVRGSAAVAKLGNGARFRVSSRRGSQVRILAAASETSRTSRTTSSPFDALSSDWRRFMVAAVLTLSMRSLLPILAVPYAPGPPASRPMPHAQPSVDREWHAATFPAHRMRLGSRRGLLVMMGILGGLVVF